jgi:hypothetical protein
VSIFSVAISLSSETLSLEELSALAGAEPTRSHAKGDRISARMPETKVRADSFWSRDSGVKRDSSTLDSHWPTIAPILESLASHDLTDVQARLSIGTNARSTGFAFDLLPEHVALLASARCGVWIDSHEPNDDTADLPDV